MTRAQWWLSLAAVAFFVVLRPAPAAWAGQDTKMVKLQLVLLVAGPNRDQPEPEAQAIQAGHLAHLEGLVRSGKAVIVGPMGDRGRVAGIVALRAASADEARQWAEADPAVRAGRLRAEVHAWWVEDGIMLPAWSTTDLEQLYFGFLVKGARWSAERTPESEETQKQHLAHLTESWKAGALVIAGPCENAGDIRGIVVYRTPTIDEARRWAEADPAVKAGRLAVDLHPWFVARGAIPTSQPKAP